jgi:hypothetical protein
LHGVQQVSVLAHVMDAQDVNALLNGDRRKPERAGQAFCCIVASSQVADNRLSRHAP